MIPNLPRSKTSMALFIIGIAALLFSFAPGAREDVKNRVQENGSLVLPFPQPIMLFDPRAVVDSQEKAVLSITFSRLLGVDERFEIQPDVLESWQFDTEN